MKRALTLLLLLALLKIVNAQTNHWTPIIGNQYNMTVYGVIVIDGIQQAVTTLEVGAFCGEECRASEFPLEYDQGVYVVPMTIRSNATGGETITFKLYDHANNQELNLECVNTVVFEADGIIIDPDNWFQFSFVTPAFHFTTAGNWSAATNWQGGALPGANDEVCIDADCTLDQNASVANLTVSDGFTLTMQTGKMLTVSGDLTNTAVDGLVIEDGAQLINASANVAATVEKDITAFAAANVSDGWYTIASPVNSMAIEGSGFLTETFDLYRYAEGNQQQNEWENYRAGHDDFTTFENGRGYLYANSRTFSPAFTGTLNNASITYSLSYTDRPNDNLDGFNLIGNPFPHNIYKGAGGAIDNAVLASGFYTLTNEGVWHVHTYDDAILPGQGILVKASKAEALSIAKTNSEATAESSAKRAAGRMRLTVAGDGDVDRVFVIFGEGTSLDKMPNINETVPSLYIGNNDHNYAIVHVGNDCETLDLMFSNKRSGNFVLGAEFKDLRFSYLHLMDLLTGTDTDLLLNPSYSFTATGLEPEARFRLVFKVMTGVDETAEAEPFAYVSDGQIVITGMDAINGSLQIIDMTGRVILTQSGDAKKGISTESLAPGVYMLRLSDGNIVKTQKLIVK